MNDLGYLILILAVILLLRFAGKAILSLISGLVRLLIAIPKYLLFHPRINSLLTIVFLFCLICTAGKWIPDPFTEWFVILWLLSGADCIRDIKRAGDFYQPIGTGIDRLYAAKSLSSLGTLGLSRPVFLFFVNPHIGRQVRKRTDARLNAGWPLPYASFRASFPLRMEKYYYERYVKELIRRKAVMSNMEMLEKEAALRKTRLAQLYPKTRLEKFLDAVSGDETVKQRRAAAENWLSCRESCRAYVSTGTYLRLQKAISKAMWDKPPFSVSDICEFDEFKPFHFSAPLPPYGVTGWGEIFVIQAFEQFVEDGVFEDMQLNDNDPLDSHIYYCPLSAVQINGIDAGTDPRLSDPDLCDA